jgi:hypothetical protein
MMASIKTDQAPNRLRNNFEASHLLPYDPVQKKRTYCPGNKHDFVDISDTILARKQKYLPLVPRRA